MLLLLQQIRRTNQHLRYFSLFCIQLSRRCNLQQPCHSHWWISDWIHSSVPERKLLSICWRAPANWDVPGGHWWGGIWKLHQQLLHQRYQWVDQESWLILSFILAADSGTNSGWSNRAWESLPYSTVNLYQAPSYRNRGKQIIAAVQERMRKWRSNMSLACDLHPPHPTPHRSSCSPPCYHMDVFWKGYVGEVRQ